MDSDLVQNITAVCDRVSGLTLKAFAFLLPLFFLPLTLDFFDFNKLYLFLAVTLILTLCWTIKMAVTKTIIIHPSTLDLPLLLVVLSAITATIMSANRYYSVLGNNGYVANTLPVILGLYLFYYSSQTASVKKESLLRLFSVGAAISAAVYLTNLLGFNFLGKDWSKVIGFSPSGSIASSLVVFTFGAVAALGLIVGAQRAVPANPEVLISRISLIRLIRPIKIFVSQSLLCLLLLICSLAVMATQNLLGVTLLLAGIVTTLVSLNFKSDHFKQVAPYLMATLTTTLALTFALIVPQARSALGLTVSTPVLMQPSLSASWLTATGTLGQHPIWGSGLNTWRDQYASFRPLAVNATAFWNTRFSSSYNYFLETLTTQGLLGLASFLILILGIAALLKNHRQYWPLMIVLLGALFLLPSTLMALIVLFLVLAQIVSVNPVRSFYFPHSPHIPYSTLGAAFLLTVITSYFGARLYLGDYYFNQSILDLAAGGKNTYALQQKALTLNPYSDLYHRNYAQTNLALAAALSGAIRESPLQENGNNSGVGANSQRDPSSGQDSPNPSADDIKILLDQATREVQIITTVLGPNNPDNWEMRGSLYESLASSASNTLPWAVSSYQTAIGLNPYNPLLRLALGGIYFSQKDYQNAAANFYTAVQLKSDLENSHYNLAHAYLELKDYGNALVELKIVKNLLAEGSEDALKVADEIDQITTLAQSQSDQNNLQTSPVGAIQESPNNKPQVAGTSTKQSSPAAKPATPQNPFEGTSSAKPGP